MADACFVPYAHVAGVGFQIFAVDAGEDQFQAGVGFDGFGFFFAPACFVLDEGLADADHLDAAASGIGDQFGHIAECCHVGCFIKHHAEHRPEPAGSKGTGFAPRCPVDLIGEHRTQGTERGFIAVHHDMQGVWSFKERVDVEGFASAER
ncbi:hypothetical protein GCM10010525_04650 [Glutamicibacter bergerei]